MQIIYDSDTFVVVYSSYGDPALAARALEEGVDFNAPLITHCFEILDKRSNREVFLNGEWAEAFQAKIKTWQDVVPEQEEVEACLDGYSQLAQLPLVLQ